MVLQCVHNKIESMTMQSNINCLLQMLGNLKKQLRNIRLHQKATLLNLLWGFMVASCHKWHYIHIHSSFHYTCTCMWITIYIHYMYVNYFLKVFHIYACTLQVNCLLYVNVIHSLYISLGVLGTTPVRPIYAMGWMARKSIKVGLATLSWII